MSEQQLNYVVSSHILFYVLLLFPFSLCFFLISFLCVVFSASLACLYILSLGGSYGTRHNCLKGTREEKLYSCSWELRLVYTQYWEEKHFYMPVLFLSVHVRNYHAPHTVNTMIRLINFIYAFMHYLWGKILKIFGHLENWGVFRNLLEKDFQNEN